MLTSEMKRTALAYMEALSCPRAVTLAIMIRHDQWLEIASLRTEPLDFDTPQRYFTAHAATAFFQKCQLNVKGVNRAHAARQKWWEAERRCFNTNRKFYELSDFGTIEGSVSEEVDQFLIDFSKHVREILGRLPDDLCPVFGPGAVIGSDVGDTPVDKISSRPKLTREARCIEPLWRETMWARATDNGCLIDMDEVRGNTYFTVPKTALTDRSCAKEPSFNAAYQRALGRCMVERLSKFGFDMKGAKSIHNCRARLASRFDDFSTIDLASASDTVALSLLEWFPPLWKEAILTLRSPYTCMQGRDIRLEKVSSMGNGFTFELEMVIFAAVCLTADSTLVPNKTLFVWGDDLIVPKRVTPVIRGFLSFFGFEINTRKTFTDGPFRESCGGDFWDGFDVRGYFLKELPSDAYQWIQLANGVYRTAELLALLGLDSRLMRRCWHICHSSIPLNLRVFGPRDLGGVCLHTTDETKWSTRERGGIRFVRTLRVIVRTQRKVWSLRDTDFLAALLCGQVVDGVSYNRFGRVYPSDGLIERYLPTSYRVGWTAYS